MAPMNAHVQALLSRIIETVHSEGYPNKVQELTGPIYAQFGYTRPVPKEVLAAVGALFALLRGKVRPQGWLRSRSDLLRMVGAIQEDYKNAKTDATPSQSFYAPSQGYYPPSQMYYPTSAPPSHGFYPPSQGYYHPSQMMDYSEASQQLPEQTYATAADIFVKEETHEQEGEMCPIAKWNQEKKISEQQQEIEQLKEQVERLQTELRSKEDSRNHLANLITQKDIEILGLREQAVDHSGM